LNTVNEGAEVTLAG